MEVEYLNDNELYTLSDEINKIGNFGIQTAIQYNKENRIPIVYSVDNKIYYEIDGKITCVSPFMN